MDEADRRLAGILAADVVGYSTMIGTDERATLARVRALRTEIVEPLAAKHGGRLFKTMGDGFLVAFASAVQALGCAVAIQEALQAQPDGLRLRIGVHQGEVVAEGDDLLGDGVIVAARLEPLAEPGGICISGRVREDATGKLPLEVDDLGTPELKNIAVKIQVYRVRAGAAERPALPLGPPAEPAPAHRNNLPQLAHALIGRERDVAEIEALLSRHRLVTLVGAPGIGKTRLSLQVGADLLARFPDGAWFVELAPLDRPELVGEAVAAVFGLPVQGERPATDAITAYLRSRRMLLILDNCEHVIAAAAQLADALLKTCPGVFGGPPLRRAGTKVV